ncbi:MAG: winged helix-turn-helix transcriptional regulator [Rhodospirillales bacterium]|nr:winged helix-turn-helix transcriptional regulator [Acetobacter sp.]
MDLLDGAVTAAYEQGGLRFRPRYTPVVRALLVEHPATVTRIAALAGITQPAATQTVALMVREGLLCAETNQHDNRQRNIRFTAYGRRLLPRLQGYWDAADAAASSLDAELPFPLSELLTLATDALAKDPFGSRMQRARKGLPVRRTSKKTGAGVTTS